MSDIQRIIAFDVETPNRYGNSICSIGITISEPGKAPVSRQYLVNPEADFEDVYKRQETAPYKTLARVFPRRTPVLPREIHCLSPVQAHLQ